MAHRTFILLAAVLVVLFAGVAGVYAYDHSGRGTIADGVTVAGIDVGGLNAEQARARLERDYVSRLREPIVVRYGEDIELALTAEQTRAAANLSSLVDAALTQGREESVIARTWRRLSGSELDADVAPNTVFDQPAVDDLVAQVRDAVDRGPSDARVSFDEEHGLQVDEAVDGLTVDTEQLGAAVEHAVTDTRATRIVQAPVRRAAPAVTDAELAKQYETALYVNRKRFTLTLYKDLEKVKTYRVAVGALGLETPAGTYKIQNKAINPAWTKPHSSWVKPSERGDVVPGGTPQNPLKARWMGIFDGAGIHGIDPSAYGSIGHAASHGCVRMRIPDVIELYDEVPVGTPIYIG